MGMSSFFNRFVVVICKLVARLPFWFLFILADIFYVLLYYVIRYRRKVVHENLTRSFPEKSAEEIRQITKRYYHHLSDLGIETIKFSNMTEAEINDRIKLNNAEIFEEYYQKGKSAILLGMHHNNWEWALYFQRVVKAQLLVVYDQLRSNKAMERFLLDSRERFGAKSVVIEQSARVAFSLNQAKRPSVLLLLADQTSPANSQIWANFLNQETAFFAGPMKIAVKTNQPVMFFHIRKVGRSRYEAFVYKLVENPSEVEPEQIMLDYVRKMEEIIRAEPEYWLWTHRRWKHKRPAHIPLW
jgi:KDO2-lipid IV(A) lauroyltransferase